MLVVLVPKLNCNGRVSARYTLHLYDPLTPCMCAILKRGSFHCLSDNAAGAIGSAACARTLSAIIPGVASKAASKEVTTITRTTSTLDKHLLNHIRLTFQ